MTVQEWVAALPPLESHSDEDQGEAHGEDHGDCDEGEDHGDCDEGEDQDKSEPSDHIRLGEEASYFVPGGVKNFGQLLLQKNNKNIRFGNSGVIYKQFYQIFSDPLSSILTQ